MIVVIFENLYCTR